MQYCPVMQVANYHYVHNLWQRVFGGTPNICMFWLFPENGIISERSVNRAFFFFFLGHVPKLSIGFNRIIVIKYENIAGCNRPATYSAVIYKSFIQMIFHGLFHALRCQILVPAEYWCPYGNFAGPNHPKGFVIARVHCTVHFKVNNKCPTL